MYMDLDRFKPINDRYGHEAGDAVLQQVAALLRSKLRRRDSLARLGGDEFGLLLEHCPRDKALRTAKSLLSAIAKASFQ